MCSALHFILIIGLAISYLVSVSAELAAFNSISCPLPQGMCVYGDIHISNPLTSGPKKLPLNETMEYIHALLQEAIMVEHSTIPLYLTALYSIADSSESAVSVIHSVVIEEMMHMTVAANVLNAVGGAPRIDAPNFVPEYPLNLPMTNVSIGIQSFDLPSVHNFMLVESTTAQDKSIGAAYVYILELLRRLCDEHGEHNVFVGNFSYQIEMQAMNQTAPKIANLQDATAALMAVSDQGGGCPIPGQEKEWPDVANISAGPLGGDLSHFARFSEIALGRRFLLNDTIIGGPTGPAFLTNWSAMHRFKPNPRVSDFEGTEVYEPALAFAVTYTELLVQLHNVFNGAPETFGSTMSTMFSLTQLAKILMSTADPRSDEQMGVGPCWEYMPAASQFADRHGKARPIIPGDQSFVGRFVPPHGQHIGGHIQNAVS